MELVRVYSDDRTVLLVHLAYFEHELSSVIEIIVELIPWMCE